jgi:hypothetical protein
MKLRRYFFTYVKNGSITSDAFNTISNDEHNQHHKQYLSPGRKALTTAIKGNAAGIISRKAFVIPGWSDLSHCILYRKGCCQGLL